LYFLINSSFIYGQIDSMTENEVITKICSGKWYIEYIGYDDIKEYHEEFTDWLNFYTDGTIDISEEDGFVKKEYSYNHIKKTINYGENKKTAIWFIDKLNDQELTLKQIIKDKVIYTVCNKTARKSENY
jgi:hypothetical protein